MLVDLRGRETQELTTTIHTVTLSAPVGSCRRPRRRKAVSVRSHVESLKSLIKLELQPVVSGWKHMTGCRTVRLLEIMVQHDILGLRQVLCKLLDITSCTAVGTHYCVGADVGPVNSVL